MTKKDCNGVTIWYEKETYKELKQYAALKGKSMNSIVREWTKQGLHGNLCEENIDLISKIIREQMSAVLKPYEERNLKIQSNNSVHTGTSIYLLAELLHRLPDIGDDIDIEILFELARKKALADLKCK